MKTYEDYFICTLAKLRQRQDDLWGIWKPVEPGILRTFMYLLWQVPDVLLEQELLAWEKKYHIAIKLWAVAIKLELGPARGTHLAVHFIATS